MKNQVLPQGHDSFTEAGHGVWFDFRPLVKHWPGESRSAVPAPKRPWSGYSRRLLAGLTWASAPPTGTASPPILPRCTEHGACSDVIDVGKV